ncbi:g10843 [Coccomyxa elongata]
MNLRHGSDRPWCSSARLEGTTEDASHSEAGTSTSGQSEQRQDSCLRHKKKQIVYRELPLLLALMVGLMVAFHAASCGYFFCFRFPGVMEFPRDIYDDIRDIYILAGGPRWTSRATTAEVDDAPKLIPKVIHQTYKSGNIPGGLKPFMHSWRRLNEDWEIRFYDDEACLKFVQREFPEYIDAYRSLAKDVERSDFFRYMVVLRMGGVYADIDTECRKPLNNVILPRDTLVVGWENEFSTAEEAQSRKYVRKRQVLQWTFAGAPGHPALREICDHIARHTATAFSASTNVDTLERTGPGVWTDTVLKHAHAHPPSKKDDPWTVRVLPKVYFGVHPLGLDGVSPDDPDIVVLHHFLGSWKVRGGWSGGFGIGQLLRRAASFFSRSAVPEPVPSIEEAEEQPMEMSLPRDRLTPQLYPVSMVWQPPFTQLVDLVGHGDMQAGVDVAATLTAWGKWQPALAPGRGPSVAEALIGSLGGKGAERRVLVDIGAGNGYFSLAAAARGHRVIAFELSNKSLASFEASVAYNGFDKMVTLHKVALGSREEEVCVDAAVDEGGSSVLNVLRGYGHPSAHNLTAVAEAFGGGCNRTALRRIGSDLVPEDVEVGAIRVSVTGWEGWVMEGLAGLMARRMAPPAVVLLELQPHAMARAGYEGGALRLLRTMHSWGYTDVSHSGHVCDERWHNITRSIRLRGAMALAAQEALRQPTWCTLPPDKFAPLVERASRTYPENILFVYKAPTATTTIRIGTAPAPGPAALPPSTQTAEISPVGLVPPRQEISEVGPAAPQASLDGSGKGGTAAGAAGTQRGLGMVGSGPGQPGSAGLKEGFNQGRRAASAA